METARIAPAGSASGVAPALEDLQVVGQEVHRCVGNSRLPARPRHGDGLIGQILCLVDRNREISVRLAGLEQRSAWVRGGGVDGDRRVGEFGRVVTVPWLQWREVNWSADEVGEVPAGLVTVTSTVPDPAGAVAEMDVSESTLKATAGVDPN